LYKMQLTLLLAAILLVGALTVPSFAQTIISSSNSSLVGQNLSSTGLNITFGPGQVNYTYIPISGQISFDPNNYNNVTSVTQMTIYARNSAGIDTKTNPAANGTFSMMVPGNGTFSIYVIPAKLDYLDSSTNETYSIIYPAESKPYLVNVTDSGVTGIVIPTQTLQTGLQMNATPMPPSVTAAASPTATPTPGFTAVAALIIVGIVAAIAYKKK